MNWKNRQQVKNYVWRPLVLSLFGFVAIGLFTALPMVLRSTSLISLHPEPTYTMFPWWLFFGCWVWIILCIGLAAWRYWRNRDLLH